MNCQLLVRLVENHGPGIHPTGLTRLRRRERGETGAFCEKGTPGSNVETTYSWHCILTVFAWDCDGVGVVTGEIVSATG